MIVEQRIYTKKNGWQTTIPKPEAKDAQVVFLFGETSLLKEQSFFDELKTHYPQARIIGCSTAGEIAGVMVRDNSLVATAVLFNKTALQFLQAPVAAMEDSYEVGANLAKQLANEPQLTHMMVFSDGLNVNGSELVRGITSNLPRKVALTGGLSGDQDRFKQTLVCLDGPGEERIVVGIGFYGEFLAVNYGSMGGWDPFGDVKTVTKSKGNVVYELDYLPALTVYKKYMGDKASGLPATGLLFPFYVTESSSHSYVRTILGVSEEDNSMTFAGDVPEGSKAQFMRANFEQLIKGASGAASMAAHKTDDLKPDLAILVSCVGRKLVLQEKVSDEIASAQKILGPQAALTGFYSYGEICPTAPAKAQCELHNQTMTITTFRETDSKLTG